MAFGPDGLIYVASLRTSSVLRYQRDGTFVDVFIAPGRGGVDLPTFLTFRSVARDVGHGAEEQRGAPQRSR